MDSMVEEPLLTSSSNGQPGSQPPNRIPNIPEENNSLFSIVKKGTLKKLKSELRKTRKSLLTQTDENGKTILHHAVEFAKRKVARKMVEKILRIQTYLKSKDLIDMLDSDGKTALYIAAEKGREKIVGVLLYWDPNLRIKCGVDGKTPLDLIYKNVPKQILTYYNNGVKLVEDQENIRLDFSFITSAISAGDDDEDTDDLKETKNFQSLLKGSADEDKEMLEHALVQAFIYLKYNKAYPFIIFSIFIHLFWHALYAYFIFNVYYINCPWKHPGNGGNGTELTIQCSIENKNSQIMLAVSCWILGLSFFLKEIFELITVPNRWKYFKEMENNAQILVCLSLIFISSPFYAFFGGRDNDISIAPWQYRLASGIIFTVFALVLGQICKIKQLRIFIELFNNVFKGFVKFICTFAPLLFGFAFAFCILMPEGKAFQSSWLAVPKVLVMMTGELNYDDVFHGEQKTYHYLAAQCLFTLFTVLISMILLNLLIGLAVSETQELKARSHLSELSNMVKEIFLLECFGVRLRDQFGVYWLLHRLSIINENMEGSKNLNPEDPSEKMFVVEKLTYTYSIGKSHKNDFPPELMEKLCRIAYDDEDSDDEDSDDDEESTAEDDEG